MNKIMNRSFKIFISVLMCFSLISLKSVDVSAASKKLKVTSLKASCGSKCKVKTTIRLTANASGGKGTKKYQFLYKKGSTTKIIRNYSTSKSVTYKVSGVGTYKFIVKVKDSKGTVKQKTKTVKSTGFISTCSVSGSKYVNQPLTITAGSQGGTGSKKYRIQVSFNGGGYATIKAYSSSKSVSYTPTQTGTYKFRVTTKDKKKKTASTTKTISVVNEPVAAATVSNIITSSQAEVTVGTTYQLGLNIAAGETLSFTTSNPSACLAYWYKSGNTYNGYLMPTGEGWATITAYVTSNGSTRSQSFNVYSHDNSNVKIGCDISYYQKDIDIQALKNIGFDYVILRAGHGSESDTKFVSNVKKCLAAQMPFGVYWYSTATSAAAAQAEANALVSQLSAAGISYASQYFDFPIYYDLESSAQLNAIGAGGVETICSTFESQLNAHGIPSSKMSIYANKNWLEKYLDSSYYTRFEDRIWFARYNVSGSTPTFYWDNNSHTVAGRMWQVGSGFENITGLPSGCRLDMDYYYGSIALTGSGTVNVSNKVYDDKAVTASYSSTTNGNSNVSVQYRKKDSSTWSTTAPKDAGTYVVKATFPATSSFKSFYVEKTFTISKANNTATVDVVDGTTSILSEGTTYAEDKQLEVKIGTPKENSSVKVEYKLGSASTYTEVTKNDNGEYLLPVLDAGEYDVRVTYGATTNYNQLVVTKRIKVNKAEYTGTDDEKNAILATAKPVAAASLVSNGNDQALVTESSETLDVKIDHVEYAVTITNTPPEDDESWSTSIPTGKDAGTYYVWYRVVLKNYTAVLTDTTSIEVSITSQ